MALQRKQRIRGAASVTKVFTGTRPLHSGGLTARVLRENSKVVTFAVTVPVSIAPQAVRRNALRRRISEQLRALLTQHATVGGARVVITARTSELSAPEIRESLVLLLRKSGILQQ